ncbi:class I SAM-dependent methyltransferase [Geodermatophilus sp. SYSU D00758]
MLEAPAQERERKALVRTTFDAATPGFDAAALFFWERFGRRMVELADVVPGSRVLDVCCGTGASALPAAGRAGPAGRVVGIDLAVRQLERARTKAVSQGLGNARFVAGDLEHLAVADESADVVLCAFGLYFAVDLPAAVTGLWRVLRPGGRLVVTTWGRRVLEPAQSLYLDAVAGCCRRLDVRSATLSWARINTPDRLAQVFADAQVARPAVVEESVVHPMDGPDFWAVVLGSGYRLLLDVMGPATAERVRTTFLRRMRQRRVTQVRADVLHAVVRKGRTS